MLSNYNPPLLVIGCVFLLISFFLNEKKMKLSWVLLFIALSAISVFSFAALLDPFLNLWDERFHALVAKNLMDHPLKPTLYDNPIITFTTEHWANSHIWLHKQPLFLWQIALSFKTFGISEFSLRLPNILLSTIFVIISFRSSYLLFNRRVAFITAVLIISSVYLTELVAGRMLVDHNDVSFLAYVSLSIWSYIEYYSSGNKKWLFLIGLFSGFAILCKWLVGLLVYFGWGYQKLQQKHLSIKKNKDFLLSLLITVTTVLPWQLFSYVVYPNEWLKEQLYNSKHLWEAVEGHDGDLWYHFHQFGEIYGALAPFVLFLGFWTLYKKKKNRIIINSLLSMLVVTYVFFSIVVTKMPSFTIVSAMIVFMLIGFTIELLLNQVKSSYHSLIMVFFIVACFFLRFDSKYFNEKYNDWSNNYSYTSMLSHNKNVFNTLNLDSNTVIFNVKGRHYIECMFYTGLPSYNFIPDEEQVDLLLKKGYKIAIFSSEDIANFHYLVDKGVLIINQELKGYE